MLVFMEYCDRGTLEEAAKMGLPEHNIRVYTREILLAVNYLHEHNILHRDIKGYKILHVFFMLPRDWRFFRTIVIVPVGNSNTI